MGQIEMSTGDMLASDNPSFTGTPDILKAISAAMSGTCPDAANQRPLTSRTHIHPDDAVPLMPIRPGPAARCDFGIGPQNNHLM